MQAMARLWRVAHFVLNDFLDMPPPNPAAAGQSANGDKRASGAWGQPPQGQPMYSGRQADLELANGWTL